MAEDIRDMFVSGSVADYKKHTGADIYLLRNGRELPDDTELCSVGGLAQAFSIANGEPVLGIKILSADKLTKDQIVEDKAIRFLLVPESLKWDHFEPPRFFFPGPKKMGEVTDLPFFEVVNEHWKGRYDGYKDEPYVLGHYTIFRNVKDGITIDGVAENAFLVMRQMPDGKKRVFWPVENKNFIID